MQTTNPRLHWLTATVLSTALLTLTACGAGGQLSGDSGGDSNPPTPGLVNDGTGADIDTQTDTTTLSANWSGFVDAEGPLSHYEWGIASISGQIVMDWTIAGTDERATKTGLSLVPNTIYVVLVRAVDLAGNLSLPAFSDGVLIQDTGGGNGGGTPLTATTLSQHGITWRFATARPVGKFCNGDWWVVGPVDVVEITPRSTTAGGRVMHGSMVNPIPNGEQGYDSSLYGGYASHLWNPGLNVALGVSASAPLRLAAGKSLVSTISNASPHANGSISELKTAAVLTVLADAPPADAFRPGYAGADKTVRFREDDIDYSAVATLPAPPGTPATSTLEPWFERVWLDHTPGWVSRFMHPAENMHDYSRDFTTDIGAAALQLNLDLPIAAKRKLMIGLLQIGIDNWAAVQNGCRWPPTGGQCSGRKFPILFAGTVLGDAAMANVGFSHGPVFLGPNDPGNRATFGEDGQVFFVQQTSAGVFNYGFGGYTAADVNMPEWGNNHVTDLGNDHRSWSQDPYRRCCTANAWIGQCLAMRIMNLRTAWNQPAFFAYMDRYVVQEPTGWTNAWDPWQATMWNTYRASF